MKYMTIFCDHCGNPLKAKNDFEDIRVEMNHKFKNVDLCIKCFEELWNIIDDYSRCGEVLNK